MFRRVLTTALLLTLALPAAARADYPDPAYVQADVRNMAHAHGRMVDMYSNPAYGRYFWTETLRTYPANVSDQLHHPDRPILTASQVIPGGTTADPYRQHWAGARGISTPIEYLDSQGARITGNVWAPKGVSGPVPGVVITTGSIQGYEELYWWAAQGLAEAGYVVMTWDVQGQGGSETFPHHPDGSIDCSPEGCPGVPFQQADNFYRGTTEALDWFLSDANPFRGLVDETRVGLAGHSLGAGAVSQVGNADLRVDAVVAWDNLGNVANPRIPSMGQNAEYFFNVTPTPAKPDPEAKNAAFRGFRQAGVPSAQIALRGSTHLEWTFVPYILPASRLGERVAMYYTLAWFDRWLYPDRASSATGRLAARSFDGSADASSIGMGSWDAATNSNRPYTIENACDLQLSDFYRSSMYLPGDGIDIADLGAHGEHCVSVQ